MFVKPGEEQKTALKNYWKDLMDTPPDVLIEFFKQTTKRDLAEYLKTLKMRDLINKEE